MIEIDQRSRSNSCSNSQLDQDDIKKLSSTEPLANDTRDTHQLSAHLLSWINETLQASYKSIEELSDGAAYAQLMHLLYPLTVPLKLVKFRASHDYQYIHNLEIVQAALDKVGCDREIPISKLVFKKSRSMDNLEFLQWFKKFFDSNYDGHEYDALEAREHIQLGENRDRQLVVAHRMGPFSDRKFYVYDDDDDDDEEGDEDVDVSYRISQLDHNWSKKILELVGTKAQLVESFTWLSTVGGGFSSLGERDKKFSMRAATLSLGHQMRLAELLGDQRLKIMCHYFAALAALQMDEIDLCRDYLTKVIIPMYYRLPHRDPILWNMLKHIMFRLNSPSPKVPILIRNSPRNAIMNKKTNGLK